MISGDLLWQTVKMPLNHFCFLPLYSSTNPSERNELKNYTQIISPSLEDPKNLLTRDSCRILSYFRDVKDAFCIWSFWKSSVFPPSFSFLFFNPFYSSVLCFPHLSSPWCMGTYGSVSHICELSGYECGCILEGLCVRVVMLVGEGYIRPADPSHSSCQT